VSKLVSKIEDSIIKNWEKKNNKSLSSLSEIDYLNFIEKYNFKSIVFKI
jgi:hypothetical protein